MPQHTLQGVDAFTEELRRAESQREVRAQLLTAAGRSSATGGILRDAGALRSTVSDAYSYSRDRSFELTISDGKVSRYEMAFSS